LHLLEYTAYTQVVNTELPFSIIRRVPVPGGLMFTVQHQGCGGESTFFVPDDCDFKRPIPIECPCGFKIKMGFGSPETARKMVALIKLPTRQDLFNAALSRSPN
jgi:hypothetical protein